MVIETVDAQGKTVSGTYAAVADGKPHPITGNPDYDTGTLTRATDTVATYMYQKRRTNVVIGNRVLSGGGSVLTFNEKRYDDKGKQVASAVIVFAKPGFDFASLAPPPPPARPQVGQPQSVFNAAEQAAIAVMEKGDDDGAIAAFTKIIDTKPATPMLYYDHVSRGISYAKKNQNELALADFDAAVKLKPDDVDARFRLGSTRLTLKQYDAAIADFTAVVTADPMHAMAYRLRGYAYNTQGRDKDAAPDYDKACALDKSLCQ